MYESLDPSSPPFAPLPLPRSLDAFLQEAYDSTVASAPGRRPRPGGWSDQHSASAFAPLPPWLGRWLRQARQQWRYALMVCALGLSSAADASEMFTTGYLLGNPSFQRTVLGGDLAGRGAVVAGILNLGLIVGGLAAGSVEGRRGRRSLLLVGLLLTAAAGFASAAVPGGGAGAGAAPAALFALCRFAAGLGIGPVLASTCPLATEISPPRERGLVVSVANSFWTVGLIANSMWAYFLFGKRDAGGGGSRSSSDYGTDEYEYEYEYDNSSWRTFLAVCTLPSVAGGVLVWALVPESPRYLALRGRYDLAARSANRVAMAMGYRGRLLDEAEVGHHFGWSSSASASGAAHGSSARADGSPMPPPGGGMRQIRLVFGRDLRRPTLTVMVLWIAASVGGSLGQWLVTIFRSLGLNNIYLNFILLNFACIPGNVASALFTDRVGRNLFLTAAMLLSAVALFGNAWVVLGGITKTGNQNNDNNDDGSSVTNISGLTGRIMAWTALFYGSMTAIYTVLYVMAAELFPTTVRSTGVAVCSTFGRIAGILAMFLNGALVDRPVTLLSVGGTVLLFGSALALVCPPREMKLRPVLDRADSDCDDDNDGGGDDSNSDAICLEPLTPE